ncbi:hypothetical protein F4802DRAFT_8726 [Xylaria palmicola]|nr:hypothetical protein F4802DRAFT_8726 [Xylaria palmicola]
MDSSDKKRRRLAPLFYLSVALWIAVLAVGTVVGLGCIYNDNLYIVRLSSNHSSPIQVSLGYAGTCVRTMNSSACISHSNYDDDEPLASQFEQKLNPNQSNGNTTNNTTNGTPTEAAAPSANTTDTALQTLLTLTTALQTDVFPLAPPVIYLALFALSTVLLWCLLPSPTGGALASRAVLAAAAVANGYGLALGLMVALATRQAGEGLRLLLDVVAPGAAEEGEVLQALQWLVVALSAVLQICLVCLFVLRRRRPGEGDAPAAAAAAVVNNFSFASTTGRCCCF